MTELGVLSPEFRRRFAQLADVVVPATATMPSAGQVGVAEGLLDRVLRACPELAEPLVQALNGDDAGAPEARLLSLQRDQPVFFSRVVLAVLAAYYLSPEVRQLIGYPGQQAPGIDIYELPEYLENGSLDRVIARGPFYRSAD